MLINDETAISSVNGKFFGDNYSKHTTLYDLETKELKELANNDKDHDGKDCATASGIYFDDKYAGDKVYVGGGTGDERIMTNMRVYNLEVDNWTCLPSTAECYTGYPLIWKSNNEILNICGIWNRDISHEWIDLRQCEFNKWTKNDNINTLISKTMPGQEFFQEKKIINFH